MYDFKFEAIGIGEKDRVIARAIVVFAGRVEDSPTVRGNATGEFVDLVKAGIVDPTKVARSALQNASSIAGLMLTTEVMITKIDEEDPKNKVSGAIR